MTIRKVIKKYWQNTPELFSEKYETSIWNRISPVNLFLLSRRKKTLELVGNVQDKKILDVGCGSGVFMIDLIKKGAFVVGIDYSDKMLNLAKKELNFYKIPKSKFILKKANAIKLPFKQKEFDLILATGLTDYLTDEQDQKFLKEAARALKKNGKLIVSFPVQNSPFSFIRSGIGLQIRQRFFKLPPIHNQFTLEKLRKFLRQAGLEDKQRYKILATMWLIVAEPKK